MVDIRNIADPNFVTSIDVRMIHVLIFTVIIFEFILNHISRVEGHLDKLCIQARTMTDQLDTQNEQIDRINDKVR